MEAQQHEWVRIVLANDCVTQPMTDPIQLLDQYLDFQTITSNSLHQALAENALSLSKEAIDRVLKAYDSLSAFPDVAPCLKALSATSDIMSVVFSNGTDRMVSDSVKSSPDLGPHVDVFHRIVTVEAVKCYKPKPEVYHHLAKQMGKPQTRESMGEMWLVSGNSFDIVGARAVGMRAIWVNRESGDWTDKLLGGDNVGKPTATVKSLEEVLDVVKANTKA